MSVADVPQLDNYGGEDFLERCRTLDRQVALGDDAGVTARLLRGVARRLNTRDWGDLLATTDDFLVYAWEIHGEDLEEDLAASAPEGPAP